MPQKMPPLIVEPLDTHGSLEDWDYDPESTSYAELDRRNAERFWAEMGMTPEECEARKAEVRRSRVDPDLRFRLGLPPYHGVADRPYRPGIRVVPDIRTSRRARR